MGKLQHGTVHPRLPRHRQGLTDPEHFLPVLDPAEPDALERPGAVGEDKEEPGFCPETENAKRAHFPDHREFAAKFRSTGVPPTLRGTMSTRQRFLAELRDR